MQNIPDELYYNIVKFFTADSLQNGFQVSHKWLYLLDIEYVWNKVYHNTIPSKFINYGNQNYKILLKGHLSLLKHSQWFQRQAFIEFMHNNIHIDTTKYTTMNELKYKFQYYSKGKFKTVPNGWYWDSLEHKSREVKQNFKNMSKSCKYVLCEYDGKYVHWNFPRDNDKIYGIHL